MANAVLYDGTRCIGCRACSVACKSWNQNPDDLEEKVSVEGGIQGKAVLSAKTFTFMRYREVGEGDDFKWAFCKIQCMHCLHPACEGACPVGALKRDDEIGAVVYDDDRCFGCRYCMVACPFGVPTFQWDEPLPWIRKCTFCWGRLDAGLKPACVTACPTGALQLGERDDLIAEAHARIDASNGKYVDHVYGEKEAGGTSWLYISPVPFEELGLPTVGEEAATENPHIAMRTLPYYAGGVVVLMAGFYWLTKRKQKLSRASVDKGEKEEVTK